MITAILWQDDKAVRGGLELIERWEKNEDAMLWLDLENESTEKEASILCENFGYDPLVVKEAQRKRHPPNFGAFQHYFYLLNKPLTSDSEDLDFSTHQVAMFCAERLLITRHVHHSIGIEKLQGKLLDNCENATCVSIVAAFNRRLTQRYGRILLDLEQRLDEIEDLLFSSRDNNLLQELVGYSTALRKMHRILTFHTTAFKLLAEFQHQVNPDVQYTPFDDIHELMQRYLSLADLYQTVIVDLTDAYISLDSHHLNQIMKVLTVVTVIFLPLTLMVGIYGMNFENIPELKIHNGYFFLLGAMGLISFGLLLLFRKVRWL